MKNILKKLFAIQNKVGAISKDCDNPFFKSKYFDINKLIEVLEPLLEAEGVLLLQPMGVKDGKTVLITMLVDVETGEEVRSECILPENENPQKMGSTITYFRRYSLQSILGLRAEDDDANLSSAGKPKKSGMKVENGVPQFDTEPIIIKDIK